MICAAFDRFAMCDDFYDHAKMEEDDQEQGDEPCGQKLVQGVPFCEIWMWVGVVTTLLVEDLQRYGIWNEIGVTVNPDNKSHDRNL